jgi:hypothetical protein
MGEIALIDSDRSTSTADLIKAAVDEARELVKLEMELAKNDVQSELSRIRAAAITFAVAAVALNVAVALGLFAVAVVSQAEVAVALIAAGLLFVIAGIAAYMGYRALPQRVLEKTRGRLESDVRELGERAHES